MKRRLDMASPEKVREQLGRAIEMLEKFKAREARIVRGLGVVMDAIRCDSHKRASLAIDTLMTTDLKQSKAHTYDRDAALRLAVQELGRVVATMDSNMGMGAAVSKTMTQIRMLAPEAFEETGVIAEEATA